MAKAAYCSQCGTNVYVTPDGRCPQGHGPEFLSDYYETTEPGAAESATTQQPAEYAPPAYAPATAPGQGGPVQPPQKKSKVGLIVGIILLILVLCAVGVGVTMCTVFKNANDIIETGLESGDITLDGDTAVSGGQGPDTTPALEPGVARVVLGWDQPIDMDLEIWDSAGEGMLTSAGSVNEDVLDGSEGREYFDFTGDYADGEFTVSVFFADTNEGPNSSNATVTIYNTDGSSETRSALIKWDPGEDQWHAVTVDAATGDFTDVDSFVNLE